MYINSNWRTYGNFSSISDWRLKKNITSLENSLEKVLKIRGVNYFWKDKAKSTDKQIWLIAQNVEKVVPEAVTEGADWYKAVSYDNLIVLVIEAIKELATKVETIADKYMSQAKEIKLLKKQFKKQQSQIEELKAIVCLDHKEMEICK